MTGPFGSPPVNILTISDQVEKLLYDTKIAERFNHIDLLISCGDLPPYYLEFIVSMLNVPLFGVHGNHDHGPAYQDVPSGSLVAGTVDLHGQVARSHGLLLAGFGGSQRYNHGPHQYSEGEMRRQVIRLAPRLYFNKLRYGRYLDILVTHAPPRAIHDQHDRCHQGFETFRRFLQTFQPRYHLHGHIHVYNKYTVTRTQFGATTVLNAYGFRELQVDVAPQAAPAGPHGRSLPVSQAPTAALRIDDLP